MNILTSIILTVILHQPVVMPVVLILDPPNPLPLIGEPRLVRA